MSNQNPANFTVDQRIHARLALLIEALVQDEDLGTFRALAKATGVGHNTIFNWCNGISDPRLQKLIQFAYSLGWSMSELMSFAEGNEDPLKAIERKKKEKQIPTPDPSTITLV